MRDDIGVEMIEDCPRGTRRASLAAEIRSLFVIAAVAALGKFSEKKPVVVTHAAQREITECMERRMGASPFMLKGVTQEGSALVVKIERIDGADGYRDLYTGPLLNAVGNSSRVEVVTPYIQSFRTNIVVTPGDTAGLQQEKIELGQEDRGGYLHAVRTGGEQKIASAMQDCAVFALK